jgi:hypothetical protein
MPAAMRAVSMRLAGFARLAAVGDSTRAPHSLQKRAPDESGALQRAHSPAASGEPQAEQNFPVAGAPQDGQMLDGESAALIQKSPRLSCQVPSLVESPHLNMEMVGRSHVSESTEAHYLEIELHRPISKLAIRFRPQVHRMHPTVGLFVMHTLAVHR